MTTERGWFELGGLRIELQAPPEVFQPNLTTKLLAECVDVKPGTTVLDLGCGCGPLAIAAARKGAKKVYAVDLMPAACEWAARNAQTNGVGDIVEVRQGSLFEPVKGLKFDLIIDDVSGIAEEVSRMSPWYPVSIPTGSVDGAEPTLTMLNQAREHLNQSGQLYFPLISLANARRIMACAHSLYGDCLEMVSEKLVPFCKEFMVNYPRLEALRQDGLIDFCQVRSRFLWNVRIYRATT